MKNISDGINYKLDMAEKMISELEVTAIDIPKMRQRKRWNAQNNEKKKFYNIYKDLNIHVTRIPKWEEE